MILLRGQKRQFLGQVGNQTPMWWVMVGGHLITSRGTVFWCLFYYCVYIPCKEWDKLPTSTGERRIFSHQQYHQQYPLILQPVVVFTATVKLRAVSLGDASRGFLCATSQDATGGESASFVGDGTLVMKKYLHICIYTYTLFVYISW